MAGRFYNTSKTAFMVILSVLMVIQRINAIPHKLPGYYSYNHDTQPVAKESANQPSLTLSEPEDPKDSAETAVEWKSIHYSQSSASYGDGRGESQVFEMSKQNGATEVGNEEHNVPEERSWDKDPAEDDDDEDVGYDDDDSDDDKDDNNNNDHNNNITDINQEIDKLIKNAFSDDIFITPTEWNALFGSPNNDGSASLKPPKIPRFPGSSYSGVTTTINKNSYEDHKRRGWVFPDELTTRRPRMPAPRCANSTYCLDPEYYPTNDQIDLALRLRNFHPITDPSTISERMGPEDDENGLCYSASKTIKPKTGVADDNNSYFILNNEKYEQLVHVEECRVTGSTCRWIEGFTDGFKSTCKQKYIYRQLISLEEIGGPAVPRFFQMPSSCCCHVKYTGNPQTRIGMNPGKINQQSAVPQSQRN